MVTHTILKKDHLMERLIPIVDDEVKGGRKSSIETLVEMLDYVIGRIIVHAALNAAGKDRRQDFASLRTAAKADTDFLLEKCFSAVWNDFVKSGTLDRISSGNPH